MGIDNRRAGYAVTSHLIRGGCRRVIFIGRPGSAPTVDARIAGFREAIADAKMNLEPGVCRIEPDDRARVRETLRRFRPEGVVCANDFTAARLLKTLTELGVSVPGSKLMRYGRYRRREILQTAFSSAHHHSSAVRVDGCNCRQRHARAAAAA